MIKKIVSIMLVICLCFFGGCAKKLPYNGKVLVTELLPQRLMAPKDYWFTEEFWLDNMISGVDYLNENYDRNDEMSSYFLYFDDLPEYRIRLVATQEEYDKIFIKPLKIDFSTEMIIIYIYSELDVYKRTIKDIKLENGQLEIGYRSKSLSKGCSFRNRLTPPQSSFLVIKMDKVECDIISFAYLYSNGNVDQNRVYSITVNQ